MISSNYVSISSEGLVYRSWNKTEYVDMKVRSLNEHLHENCRFDGRVTLHDLCLVIRRAYESPVVWEFDNDQISKILKADLIDTRENPCYFEIYWVGRKHLTDDNSILEIESDIGIINDRQECSLESLANREVKINPEVWMYGGLGHQDMKCLGYEGTKEFSFFEVFSVLTRNLINTI